MIFIVSLYFTRLQGATIYAIIKNPLVSNQFDLLASNAIWLKEKFEK